MDDFLPLKSNLRAAPLRLAARIITIMILVFLWPERGGAQEIANWSAYGQTAQVGPDGTDVSISNGNTTYTVKTPCGLAWIAWVTNEGKTNTTIGETHSDYYPAAAGFEGCTVRLAEDLSLSNAANLTDDNWIPIGENFSKAFKGTFDGNDKTITGMKITATSQKYAGLFGYLYEATVKDLTMEDGNIKWTTIETSTYTSWLGSIAGYMHGGKIINCHNKCAIESKISEVAGYAGGIVGQIDASQIIASSNSGSVTMTGTTGYGGGITAHATNKCSVVSCFNTGNIIITATKATGAVHAGGILGSGGEVSILYCYSTGDVTGTEKDTSGGPIVYCGGIAGYMTYTSKIESCFATGAVSLSSSSEHSVCAGGIVGYNGKYNEDISIVTNCLALNIDGVEVSGDAPNKFSGRIAGQNDNILSNNYASTKIELKVGDAEAAAPTENIAADAINGADLYLDEVAEAIASWAGSETTKAFTAIGTGDDGKLPQLKTITAYDTNGLPTAFGEAITGQPAASLQSAGYLVKLLPLELAENDAEIITLSFSNGKWTYTKGENNDKTLFNGTVKNSGQTSTNKLVVATATGNPTLTFEEVKIEPTDGAALTIEAGCNLTIHTTGENTSTLTSTTASTFINKGTLTLTGKGLAIVNGSTTDTDYGLENAGTFTVTDPAATSVTLHCENTAINNTGTLNNTWMEWRFAASQGDIAFAATDDDNQTPVSKPRQGKTYATIVSPAKTYRLWTVTDNGGEVRTRQTGLDSEGTTVILFPAPADNAVKVYTDVKNLETITITDSKDFSTADCQGKDVTVSSTGVLTVNTSDASVFYLTIESGGQVILPNPLQVIEEIKTSRTLQNQWIAFGSPIGLTAKVDVTNSLYTATGYRSIAHADQKWNSLSGENSIVSATLEAGTPYLLSAEDVGTELSLTAENVTIQMDETISLGDAPGNGIFLFHINPTLQNQSLSNIYVLNSEGTRFNLEREAKVKPFEAFIVANAVTRARVTSLEIGEGIATGNELPVEVGGARIWGTAGMLHIGTDAPADVVIITPAGRIVRTFESSAGDTKVALPAGIYFVRCNGITYKVSL